MDFKAIVASAPGISASGFVLAVGSVAEMDDLAAQIATASGIAWTDGVVDHGDLRLEQAMLTGPAIVGNGVTRDSACFRPTV